MFDQFDVELVDRALLEELELTTELIVAASESDAPLSQAAIDRILGVVPIPSVPRPRSDANGQDSLAAAKVDAEGRECNQRSAAGP